MGESRQRNRTRTILLSIMVLLLGVLVVRHFLAVTHGGLELEENRSRSIFQILQSTGGPGEELAVLTNDFRSSLVLIEAQKQLAGATHLVRQGSGIVVARGGWIVTSYRLIAGADRVGYRIEGGDWRPARVEASDSLTDIALLRDPDPPWRLTPAFLSDRTRLTPGEWILCLGHPAGLEFSTTWGIVSSAERREGPFALQRLLQTDAAINEGCAGGALIDLDGTVVGMISVSFSPNGGNVGINFAVPASVLRRIVPELAREGRVRRGWLGVTVGEPDREAMEALGVSIGAGAEVAGVERGSPGERAGLVTGDILLRIDGQSVQGPSDLFDRIAGSRPGEEIDIEWLHGGKRLKARVRLEERGSV